MYAKITNRGTDVVDFRFNGELTDTVANITADNAAEKLQGLAVTIDGSVDNGYKLAEDGGIIDGVIYMAEYSPAEDRITLSVSTKGGIAVKFLTGDLVTKGTVAVGAGAGLIKTSGARTAQGPIIVEDSAKVTDGKVVLMFK